MSDSARPCPVCNGQEADVLFHQDFSAYSAGALMERYDLALCRTCGAAFADQIPEQPVFDKYYADMSKYEYSASAGAVDATATARYREEADLLSPFVSRDQSIADVGCANGGLLGEFKRRGYHRVTGFDPAPASATAAARFYDVPVRTATIQDLATVRERFDVLLLTGVVEHLRAVDASLDILISLLKPGGLLYIEVPDASRYYRWFSAPYQFLSMEHVNFFAPQSLRNLLARHGFGAVFVQRATRYLSPRAVEPAVAGLFRLHPGPRSSGPAQRVHDDETGPTLRRYLEASRTLEERILATVGGLVRSQVPLAVWGTGTHTLRLLRVSELARANLVAFLDSNSRYQGKTLQGVRILAPAGFRPPDDAAILISSHVAEEEIKQQIKEKLRWPNRVICLYEDVPLGLMGEPEFESRETEMPKDRPVPSP